MLYVFGFLRAIEEIIVVVEMNFSEAFKEDYVNVNLTFLYDDLFCIPGKL